MKLIKKLFDSGDILIVSCILEERNQGSSAEIQDLKVINFPTCQHLKPKNRK